MARKEGYNGTDKTNREIADLFRVRRLGRAEKTLIVRKLPPIQPKPLFRRLGMQAQLDREIAARMRGRMLAPRQNGIRRLGMSDEVDREVAEMLHARRVW